MKIIDWLLTGDPSIKRLCEKYLLNINSDYIEEGIIKKYLDLFNLNKGMWGNGVYSPKWISTHYTMLELKYLEIDPTNSFYQQGIKTIIDHIWENPSEISHHRYPDICVIGMIISLATYGKLIDKRLEEMIDYILEHQFCDGGWNCSWNANPKPKKSSLHTTLTILEAFFDYQNNGFTYRLDDIKKTIQPAEEFILKKHLFRSVGTNEIINKQMILFHYPPRWKYDAFRALEYFASVKHPFDERMEESINIIEEKMKKGFINTGSQYSGKIHFKLEYGKAGRFNTLRALKILKFYKVQLYQNLITKDYDFK